MAEKKKNAYIHGISEYNLSKPFVAQQTKKRWVTIPDPESINGKSQFVINENQLYSAKRSDGTSIEGMYDIAIPAGHDIKVQQNIDYADKDEKGEPVPAGTGAKTGEPYYNYVKGQANMSVEKINGYIKAERDAYKKAKAAEGIAEPEADKPSVREPKLDPGFEI